jgi:quercetin dioxygenase-like cupin family protein
MSVRPFVVKPDSYAKPLNIVGEQITVLGAASRTGSYEMFLQKGPAGSGPPPHSHPWDEAFYVIKGDLEFGIGDETLTAGPGTLVHLPAGSIHWFRFGEGGGEMFSLTSGPGASDLFMDLDREIAPDAPDLAKLVTVASRHQVTVAA